MVLFVVVILLLPYKGIFFTPQWSIRNGFHPWWLRSQRCRHIRNWETLERHCGGGGGGGRNSIHGCVALLDWFRCNGSLSMERDDDSCVCPERVSCLVRVAVQSKSDTTNTSYSNIYRSNQSTPHSGITNRSIGRQNRKQEAPQRKGVQKVRVWSVGSTVSSRVIILPICHSFKIPQNSIETQKSSNAEM